MRAVQYKKYGSLESLSIEQTDEPRARRNEVKIRVARAALNPKDYLLREGHFRLLSGRQFPKLTGLDFAGEVLESECPAFRPGERVFGFLNEWRGQRGTLAEVLCASRDELAHLPASVSAEQGAAVALVGATCLQALRDIGQVRPGAKLLIHGASGGLGTMAIQIGRVLGARVTTISSAESQPLCARLGAVETRRYHELDLSRELARFDCLFDAYGSLSARKLRPALKPGAIFISTVPTVGRLLRNVLTRTSAIQERVVMVRSRHADLAQLARWLDTGAIAAVVDARYPLADVRSAFEHLEAHHCHGKVIIDLTNSPGSTEQTEPHHSE